MRPGKGRGGDERVVRRYERLTSTGMNTKGTLEQMISMFRYLRIDSGVRILQNDIGDRLPVSLIHLRSDRRQLTLELKRLEREKWRILTRSLAPLAPCAKTSSHRCNEVILSFPAHFARNVAAISATIDRCQSHPCSDGPELATTYSCHSVDVVALRTAPPS